MGRNLLARMGAKEYAELQSAVALDSGELYGIKWNESKRGRTSSIGKAFWIGCSYYSTPQVVLLLNGQWPPDDKSVATRVNNALGWNDVSNLRWAQQGDSRRLNTESRRLELVRSVLGNDGPDLGPLLRLGKVCKKGHHWNGHHELGLQRKSGNEWRCDQCERLRKKDPETQKQWYQANIEEQRQKARERMAARWADPVLAAQMKEQRNTPESRAKRNEWKRNRRQKFRDQGLTSEGLPVIYPLIQASLIGNPETRQLKRAIRSAGRCPSVARLVMNEQRRYWRENPEAKKEHSKWWNQASWWLNYQTNPDLRLYTRQKSKRRKAAMRDSVAIQLSGAQVRQRFEQFGHACAYCGATGDLHIEHVVPISKGGTHSIGNIVPACRRCNYSKTAHEVESWYRAQPFYSDLRWRKICRVLGWSRSSIGQLALL